ncbi:MAG TPA: TadE/TadG family type IV pilus assembly protein [Pseudolabrys sp.]|jgi:Flp pilus assembly protein TadG|nr:TadE/TadG family type IV pilus assembly protein [Pseudolabrys sp.]
MVRRLIGAQAVFVILQRAAGRLRTALPNEQGVAAIEFALFASLLAVSTLNVVDVSVYIYKRMELENATQMGAQAAWTACDQYQLPATTNCPGLTTAISNALQSTSLGGAVSLQSGSPAEGYYCLNSSGVLQLVGSVSNKPVDCSAVGKSSERPADYIQVSASLSYTPLFPGITVGGILPSSITKTAWMRLG